jgi:hypothetical protein
LPGTGKTLLAETIGLITSGEVPAMLAQANCEDEWRKRITALKLLGPPVIVFDNLTALDSPSVASYITTRRWVDRILRKSTVVDLTTKELLLGTGNQVQLSKELARRTVKINLHVDEQQPYLRNDFKHMNLRTWVLHNRPRLIRCLLVIIHNWVCRGMPAGTVTLGSFESWSEVMGGIFAAAEIEGFLDNYNPEAFTPILPGNKGDLALFLHYLADKLDGQAFSAMSALSILSNLPEWLALATDKNPKSQATILGFLFSKAINQQFDGIKLIQAGTNRGGSKIYQLLHVKDNEP